MRGSPTVVMLCSAIFLCLGAAPDETEKPLPPPLRVSYDVADLVHVSQVNPETTAVLPPTELSIGHSYGGSTNGTHSQQHDASTAERMDALIKLVQDSIDPAIWRDAGGSEGQMYHFDTRLIIVAPQSAHDKIVQLFADLREQQNQSVRMIATWVALTDAELHSVIVPSSQKDNAGPRIVDLSAIEKIKGAVRQRAEINTLSNQRVNITAGTARSILSSFDAVIGNGAAAMQPNIDLVLAGTALQITPILSGDGKSILLDLRAVLSRWEPPDAPPMKIPGPVASTQSSTPASTSNASPTSSTEIERLNMPVHHLTTALHIPTGKPALIGGMTTETYMKDSHQLYLIIEATGEK